jgi:hypothetical protein
LLSPWLKLDAVSTVRQHDPQTIETICGSHLAAGLVATPSSSYHPFAKP